MWNDFEVKGSTNGLHLQIHPQKIRLRRSQKREKVIGFTTPR